MSDFKQPIHQDPPKGYFFLKGQYLIICIRGSTYPLKEELKRLGYVWTPQGSETPIKEGHWERKTDLMSLMYGTLGLILLGIPYVWNFSREDLINKLKEKRITRTTKDSHKGYEIIDVIRICGSSAEFVLGKSGENYATWAREYGTRYRYGHFFPDRETAEKDLIDRVCDELLSIDKYSPPSWEY